VIRLRKEKGCSCHKLTSIGLFNPLSLILFFLFFSSFLLFFSLFFHFSFLFPYSILKLYSPLPCPFASCCNIWNKLFLSFILFPLFYFYFIVFIFLEVRCFFFLLLYFCFLGCRFTVWRKKKNIILLQIYIYSITISFFSLVFVFYFVSSFNFF
jgi:hypothetical protein